MKHFANLFSVILILSVLAIAGCGDGAHSSRAAWTRGATGGGFSGSIGVGAYQCVDMSGYKSFKASSVQSTLAGAKAATSDPCINEQLVGFKKGSSVYWMSGNSLYSKVPFGSMPMISQVLIIPYESCEQLQAATCVYGNF